MDIAVLPGPSDDRRILQQMLGQFGGPAFARRARDVQAAYDALVEACRRQREDWLAFVRLRLGTLHALAGSASALLPILASEQALMVLTALLEELRPQLRLPVLPTTNIAKLRRALAELRDSIERFNRRWLTYIQELDLRKLNELRDGYNRFYVMEKECALGSPRIARQGFRKLEFVRPEDFLNIFPLLPESGVRRQELIPDS